MSIAITDIIEAAYDLCYGDKLPSIKLALQVAACSAQQPLDRNGRLARILSKYVHMPLPDREILYRQLSKTGAILNNNHLRAIYHTERLEQIGALDHLPPLTADVASQLVWREDVYKLYHPVVDGKIRGYGHGWKTISFAALILLPLNCELVPIDRHHLGRLGYAKERTLASKKTYLAVERQITDERTREEYVSYPLGLFAWMKWEQCRLYRREQSVESHILLSCRWY